MRVPVVLSTAVAAAVLSMNVERSAHAQESQQNHIAWEEDGKIGGALVFDETCMGIRDLGEELRELTISMWLKTRRPLEGEVSLLSTDGWQRRGLHLLLQGGGVQRQGPVMLCINGNQPAEGGCRTTIAEPGKWNHLGKRSRPGGPFFGKLIWT